ncbi:secreted protein-like protein [Leptotrombidium deliense]|uniref:Secreted protein-like protein n=1 Tax=Leptotrombidium deliense TaxID=299467 RepID=A0A443RY11_9ACAR|nr:secreted protein-like protein [Leptotrombidium deliense]
MKIFPHNSFHVKYEHIALNTINYAQEMYRYLNIEFTENVMTFINEHTSLPINVSDTEAHSTTKDSKVTPSKWISELTLGDMTEVQNWCKEVFEKLNYEMVFVPENIYGLN